MRKLKVDPSVSNFVFILKELDDHLVYFLGVQKLKNNSKYISLELIRKQMKNVTKHIEWQIFSTGGSNGVNLKILNDTTLNNTYTRTTRTSKYT